jgi:hypothetical protein
MRITEIPRLTLKSSLPGCISVFHAERLENLDLACVLDVTSLSVLTVLILVREKRQEIVKSSSAWVVKPIVMVGWDVGAKTTAAALTAKIFSQIQTRYMENATHAIFYYVTIVTMKPAYSVKRTFVKSMPSSTMRAAQTPRIC